MIFPVRLIFLYTLLGTIPVIAQDELPPILDYYPDCEYQVVERVKVKVSTEHPADNNTKDELLTLLSTIDNLPLPELPHINPNDLLPFIKNDKKGRPFLENSTIDSKFINISISHTNDYAISFAILMQDDKYS